MARAATTADAFNAVAEPRRRQVLDILAGGERSVNDLVVLLDLAQPLVFKHLRVLREVGLVEVREEGRRGAVTTTTFTGVDGRTTLAVLTEYESQEVRDLVINSGMEGGVQESWDHLEQVAVLLR